ncbi:MAG: VacB/RNase II family 3'-5' exoribonuclease [Candidatus Algichlamydia australiensis]|nr:VacB/RNase II family 3'-5' exoribonuclease [Chlamydiales bacterium]
MKKSNEIISTIRVHPRGFGFVLVEGGDDIFIPKPHIASAADGDTVLAKISPKLSSKGPEGRVLKIIKRNRKDLIGIVRDVDRDEAEVFVPVLGPEKYVCIPKPKNLSEGDRVLITVTDWNEDLITCSLKKNLGSIKNAAIDVDVALLEFELSASFPKSVVSNAKKYGKEVSSSDKKNRRDLTDQPCVTIDPTTAKDFDDALFVETTPQGYRLFVHIADVSAYVLPDSPLDVEAKKRANSTYFPKRCIPMLPEELSNNLCSLKEKVDRLAATVEMEFDENGNLQNHEIYRSVIQSKKRFTYSQAREVLENKKKSPHKKTLQLMTKLCSLLKNLRRKRGSVDLAMPELILEINDKGVPTGYRLEEYDITHQMVEEFMLKANEIVAGTLLKRGVKGIFRIHDTPAEENLEDFYAVARLLGFPLTANPTPAEIQKLFDSARGTPHEKQISVAFIRSMKLATYSPENVGHYGLSLEHYTHFTSPIRRYSDLIVHRLLFDKIPSENIEQIASHLSEQERLSFRAESSVLNLKKLRLLNYLQKKKKRVHFEALVSKIKPFGLILNIEPLMIESFVHISEIGSDYYIFDPKQGDLLGERTGRHFTPGTRLKVELEHVDLIEQTTDWKILS